MAAFKVVQKIASVTGNATSASIPLKSGYLRVTPAGGDAFVEDVGIVHESKNIGNVPVKAIVVAIGVEGQKIMTPVK